MKESSRETSTHPGEGTLPFPILGLTNKERICTSRNKFLKCKLLHPEKALPLESNKTFTLQKLSFFFFFFYIVLLK